MNIEKLSAKFWANEDYPAHELTETQGEELFDLIASQCHDKEISFEMELRIEAASKQWSSKTKTSWLQDAEQAEPIWCGSPDDHIAVVGSGDYDVIL